MAGTKAEPELRRISIATVKSRSEADAISGRLKTAGIECFIVHERGAAAPVLDRRHLAAIKVQVRSADVKRAIEHLQMKAPFAVVESGAEISAPAKASLLPRSTKWLVVFVPAAIVLLVALGLIALLLQ